MQELRLARQHATTLFNAEDSSRRTGHNVLSTICQNPLVTEWITRDAFIATSITKLTKFCNEHEDKNYYIMVPIAYMQKPILKQIEFLTITKNLCVTVCIT